MGITDSILQITFGRLRKIAALSVKVDQAGASILFDGKPPQVAPNTFTHVPLGAHQVSVTLENYEPIKQEIQVRPGMSPEVHLHLQPIQEVATLSVKTEPPGASLLLHGKAPQIAPNTFTHIPFGPHQLSATFENYEPMKQEIQVGPRLPLEIHPQLRPIQEIAAFRPNRTAQRLHLTRWKSHLSNRLARSLKFHSVRIKFRLLWKTMSQSGRKFSSAEE